MKKAIISLVSVLFIMAVFTVTNADAEAKYVGTKKCKMCHIKQYKTWKKTSMGTSFNNLKPGVKAPAKKKAGLDPEKDYTKDPECLKCHTTGYGKPGGFTSLEETPKLINVGCEGCHGPGSIYWKIMKKNKKYKLKEARDAGLIIPSEDEKGCLECHSDESPFNEKLDPKYKFNFEQRLGGTHKHYKLKYKH